MSETALQFKTVFGLICLATLVLGALLILALFNTSPAQIGPVGVTLWFVGLMLSSAGVVAVLLFGIKSRLSPEDSRLSRLRSARRQGVLIGGGLTVCLALKSLRQLSLRDVLLMLGLMVLIELYFRTRR